MLVKATLYIFMLLFYKIHDNHMHFNENIVEKYDK